MKEAITVTVTQVLESSEAKGDGMAKQPRLKLAVDFGGVSFGDGTARLGATVDREKAEVDKMLETFCGRRVTGTVLVGGGDPDQGTFFKDAEIRVAGTFDSKRVGITQKKYSLGLAFAIGEIDRGDLSQFAKKRGMIAVDMTSELEDSKPSPNGEDADDDEDEGDDDE